MPRVFSKKYDVVTMGGAVRDITFYTDRGRVFRDPSNLVAQRLLGFEYGAKIQIRDANFTLGGGAANSAYVLARLGLYPAVLARVGEDEIGHGIIHELKRKNVDCRFMQRDPNRRTGFSMIVSTSKKDRDHVLFAFRGANDHLQVEKRTLNRLSARWLYITSLSGESWLKTLKTSVAHAQKNYIKIAWNPGNTQLQAGKYVLEKILKQIDVLILNKDEAIELVLSGIRIGKRNPSFLNKTVYLLNILREWGPRTVVITEGERGASALRNEKIIKVKAVKKKVVDTTGVGDTFGATLIAGLIYQGDLKTAMQWATLNSAHNLTQIGAQEGVLSRGELMRKMRYS